LGSASKFPVTRTSTAQSPSGVISMPNSNYSRSGETASFTVSTCSLIRCIRQKQTIQQSNPTHVSTKSIIANAKL
jgi:hypothetical protein